MVGVRTLAALAAGTIALGALAGCGEEKPTAVRIVTVEAPSPAAAHHAGPAAPRAASRPAFVACDRNIDAHAGTTTCPFAQNTFWAYWTSGESESFPVWSPALGASLTVSCHAGAARVSCTTRDDGEVRFPAAAIDDYSQEQADAFAADHDLGPDPTEGMDDGPTASDSPAPAQRSAPDDGAPADPSDAPDTPGENIPSYDEGDGYRVQCADGMYSHSGGIQGACSGHGGVD